METTALIDFAFSLFGAFVALLWLKPGRRAAARYATILLAFGGLSYVLFFVQGHVERAVWPYLPHVVMPGLLLLGRYMLRCSWQRVILALGFYALVRWLSLFCHLCGSSMLPSLGWFDVVLLLHMYVTVLWLWLFIWFCTRRAEGLRHCERLFAAASAAGICECMAFFLLPSHGGLLTTLGSMTLILLSFAAVLHYVLKQAWRRTLCTTFAAFVLPFSGSVAGYVYMMQQQAEYEQSLYLPLAIQTGNPAEVVTCLQRGADVNMPDSDGNTPLFYACEKNNADIVRLLLQAGANVNALNDYGSTPLINCMLYGGSEEVVRLLIDAGADVNVADVDACTPLHYVTLPENEEETRAAVPIMRMLLEHGASPNVQDLCGDTPLLQCARDGFTPGVRLLLEYQADATLRNNEDMSPLDCAEKNGHAEIVSLLRAEEKE